MGKVYYNGIYNGYRDVGGELMKLFQSKKTMRTSILIKDHVIRFVHAKRPSMTDIISFGERYLPPGIIKGGQIIDPETFQTILEECIEDWELQKQAVQFCVPDAFVVIRNVFIPNDIEDNNIRKYLNIEIGESIHLPFEESLFDYELVEETEEKKEIILIASPEKVVMSIHQLLEEVKLEPNVADISSLSVYRLFCRLDRALQNEHLLLVQLDQSSINLTVFQYHKPAFTRHFPLSLDEEKWGVIGDKEDLVVTWLGDMVEIENQAEDIVMEIERVLNFYRFSVQKGKTGAGRIVITGDHPYLRKIVGVCQDSLDIPVETLLNVEINSQQGFIPYQYHDAIGLMLKKEVR